MKKIKSDLNDDPLNDIMTNGVQRIEINRGCTKQCPYCYADKKYQQFPIPKIKSKYVQIIGENFLLDSRIIKILKNLGNIKFKEKVVYYGLSQGIDKHLVTNKILKLLIKGRFGIINNKGKWYKGFRISWDNDLNEKKYIINFLKKTKKYNVYTHHNQIFILVNYKIPFNIVLQKLKICHNLHVKIDDCYYNTTKKLKKPIFWTKDEMIDIRRMIRAHNILHRLEKKYWKKINYSIYPYKNLFWLYKKGIYK